MNIPIKEKTVKDEIGNIIPKIKELNLKIQKLEKENAELVKKVNYLMEKEEQREKEKKEEQILNQFFKESNIINSEDKKFILSLLPNRPIRTKLLYDSKIHGDTAKTFHNNCDGKSPTIYIVKSKEGYVFGGYISQPWKSNSDYTEDNSAFFFSINLKKKYTFTNKKSVFYGNPEYGPVIRGGISMNIHNNGLSTNNNFIYLDNTEQGSQFEINGGNQNFYLLSYEVFQLEY